MLVMYALYRQANLRAVPGRPLKLPLSYLSLDPAQAANPAIVECQR